MKITMLSALVILAYCAAASYGIDLYEFGPGAGDSALSGGKDPAVTVDTKDDSFFFYGKDYDHLCLSDNGFVSFGGPLSSNRPRTFPVTSGGHQVQIAKFIAPYWSDIDTRCGGRVYYRVETTNQALLDNLNQDIMLSGSGASFKADAAFIVTWENVEPSMSGTCTGKKNTFQLALVTDNSEFMTYAIFLYDTLEWHSSVYRGPATAGANAGDRTNGFNLIAPTIDILQLTMQSNIGFGGMFVHRVDLAPSLQAQVRLMANLMNFENTVEVAGVAEAELYSPDADLPLSYFNTAEVQHHHSYKGNARVESLNNPHGALSQSVEFDRYRQYEYEHRRPSRPYVQSRDVEINALSDELQKIKY